ncbi:ATP-dependent DNA helicase [Pusillimonas sp.]|uniref:ATP-dependent DNA helicase n=1 Tax=Pusillimonas sp. TaxID=3040095 RepID=UPI0037CC069B
MNYAVSVRTLCEFAARRGDLDLRFHLAPSGQEGVAGHRIVMSHRAANYQKEVTLQGHLGPLSVRGRADGFDPDARRLEEIKTYRGRLRDMPASQSGLHWAQVRVYGHLMCRKLGLDTIDLALVYFNITSGRETVRSESRSALELEQHFSALCDNFVAWAEQELRHREARDEALLALRLPFEGFRDGQRTLAKAVYRGLRDGAHQAIQAPTGIGKTMGTLFPALKAMPPKDPGKGLDKLFFLTAKTPGREVALHAARVIRKTGTKSLRVIELASREQACEHPDKHCHGQSCPLAKGFYDRLGAARASAVQAGLLDRAALRRIALEHLVCPYHLAMELVPWCDVVIGDYNYYFDVGATLHAQAETQQWRIAVLVDEAHNLVERARAMYTAALRLNDLKSLSRATAGLHGMLDELEDAWTVLLDGQAEPYRHHNTPAQPFLQALKQVAGALSEQLEKLEESAHDEALRFYFGVLHFLRMAESFGPHSVFETSISKGSEAKAPSSECVIRNVMPAPYLKPRFETSHACVLFSATLQPWEFYADVLGLPDSTAWVEVDTPFSSEQLQVRIIGDISTRWADRDASLEPMTRIIAAQYARKPGNYLVFAGSFDYLHRLAATLDANHPDIPTWTQSRDMSPAARAGFLARFDSSGRGIGFAVLGGVFAEGIDLPGERLIGAFIATLGLPQVNPVNEALKQCLNTCFAGRGQDYTYLYPGLRKVVQAAGRIIRTPQDEGVVYLMDDRYKRPVVRRLLPSWWCIEHVKAEEAAASLRTNEGPTRAFPAMLSVE